MALLNGQAADDEDIRAEKILGKLDEEEAAAAKAEAEKQPSAAEQTPQETPPEESGAVETPPTAKEEGHSEPEKSPAIEPPKFLKADFRDKWKDLPADWQTYLTSQEEESTRFVNAKTSEAAEVKRKSEAAQKAAEDRVAALTQETQRYAQQLGTFAQQMELLDPVISEYNRLSKSGDLIKLAKDNPSEYAAFDAHYRTRMGQLQLMRDEQIKAQTQALTDHFTREEKALVERIPEWADQEVGQKGISDLRSHVTKSYGFKPEEVRTIADHRYVLMARDAMAYHQLKAKVEADEAKRAQDAEAAKKAIAEKKVAPKTTPVVKPNPAAEKETAASERNKALLSKAKGVKSIAEKAALIAEAIGDR